MTVGIVGYGAYLPRYRIKADEYLKVWETFGAPGVKEKSVPKYDEDVATMSVEAAKNAIMQSGIKPEDIRAVYLGDSYGPYVDKPSAPAIAVALGVKSDVRTADFTASTKSGTAALLAACDKVRAGDDGYALVVAADAAIAAPDRNLEHGLAAGAAAFIVGSDAPLAVLEGAYSVAAETYGERFRLPWDQYTRDHELRVGYFQESVTAALKGLLARIGKESADINHVIIQSPDARTPARAVARFKFEKEQLAVGNLAPQTGNLGACSTLFSLAHVLDSAGVGERIVLASYGPGSDALSLVVEKSSSASVKKVADYLEDKEYIDYVTYLKERRFLSSVRS
ncbi:hydroxymethylglutaryl-CoA synthase [Chloroflexota bacterium]